MIGYVASNPEEEMRRELSDYDARMAREIARQMLATQDGQQHIDPQRHVADHDWITRWRTRCEWWRELGARAASRAAENVAVHAMYALLVVAMILMDDAARAAVLTWLGLAGAP